VRIRSRLGAERGYSLVELLTVMAIMGVVMTGVTALLVQGSNAEVDMNGRFQAQQDPGSPSTRFAAKDTVRASSRSPARRRRR